MIDMKTSHHHRFPRALRLIRFLEDAEKGQNGIISPCVGSILIFLIQEKPTRAQTGWINAALRFQSAQQRWFSALIANTHYWLISSLISDQLEPRLAEFVTRNVSREFTRARLNLWTQQGQTFHDWIKRQLCHSEIKSSSYRDRRIKSHCSSKPLHV